MKGVKINLAKNKLYSKTIRNYFQDDLSVAMKLGPWFNGKNNIIQTLERQATNRVFPTSVYLDKLDVLAASGDKSSEVSRKLPQLELIKTEEEESEEEGEVRDNEPLSPPVGEKEEDPDQPQTQAWPSDEEAWNTAEDGSADKENQEPNAPRPDADENWELALRRDAQEHWTQSDKKSQPY